MGSHLTIKSKIFHINGYRILFDFDLAALYEVETRVLKQAVRRNMKRFPSDFLFQLSREAWKEVITNCDNLPTNIRFSPTPPFAFTEHGVVMLSSVLKSKKAIQVNISIMRTFVMLRQHLTDYTSLQMRLKKLELSMDKKFSDVYEALNYLIEKERAGTKLDKRKKIGFNVSQ